MLRSLFPCLLCVLSAVPALGASEVVSTLADQTAIAVTIYNHDLALVRDSRQVTLASGQQTLAFREVSARIRPQTVLLTAPDLQVLEQNFEYDLLSPQSLLEKYVGREVQLVKTHPTTGEEVLKRLSCSVSAAGLCSRSATISRAVSQAG